MATSTSSAALTQALRELNDTLVDFRRAPTHSADRVLARLMHQIDSEPIASFLASTLPPVDFDRWFAEAESTVASSAGSGHLEWPVERVERIAMQVQLCRALSDGRIKLLDFAMNYFFNGQSTSGLIYSLYLRILQPMHRDIERLTKARPIPANVEQAIGSLPKSGDQTLDRLIADACDKYKAVGPLARTESVEKMWDAWERLKTLNAPGDKRASITQLLDEVTSEPNFRALLEAESRTLTDIGNKFHIRHFEADKVELPGSEHCDYLFHRMLAMIHLLS